MTALSISHAAKTYANGFSALKDVSFDVEQGEFFALLGPNGAGKTTLISAMAGLLRLSSGRIAVMGFDSSSQSHQARMNLGVVPQELIYDPFFTVREALRFQSGYFGIQKNDDWIDEILTRLGLEDKAATNTRNLSGGMKRRVMVAQALVHRPPVIVLDEPTAGVDVELRQSLWTFMRSLNKQGHTIILTTHYLEEAEENCRRIAVMKQGRLVALDQTDRLLRSEKGIRAEILLDARLPQTLENKAEQTGNCKYILKLADYNELADILIFLKTAGIRIMHMNILEKDLEQVFTRLTGDAA